MKKSELKEMIREALPTRLKQKGRLGSKEIKEIGRSKKTQPNAPNEYKGLKWEVDKGDGVARVYLKDKEDFENLKMVLEDSQIYFEDESEGYGEPVISIPNDFITFEFFRNLI